MKRQPKAKRPRGRPADFSPDERAELSRLSPPLIRRLAARTGDARLNFFHMLPGVWQDGDFGTRVWSQIRAQLEASGDLNASERAVLIDLLNKIRDRPAARKALGIRRRSRTAERNDAIADFYVNLRMQKIEAVPAVFATRKHFPDVGAAVIRKVLESARILGSARVRAWAAHIYNQKEPHERK